jgi:hypothetical protein
MAVDTKQKRMSAETLLKMWHPWVWPEIAGITANERAAMAGTYSGFVAGPITDLSGGRDRRLLLINVK